jgi:hypothetical protein
MIRYKILTFILLSYSIVLLGQEQENVDLLKTDTSWSKEIFHFPIQFAPEINYQGIEEARFPKGWGKVDSPEFWSYVFAWHIDLNKELTEKDLETNLQIYFDGLMSVVNKDTGIVVPSTIALFLKKDEGENTASYVGKVRVYDAFRTKKTMILNVLVESYSCEQKKKSIIVFKFSPQEFESDVWLKLNEVKLHKHVCD